MSELSAVAELITALTALPEFNNPITPLYAALSQPHPLTLAAIRQQTNRLHQYADQAQDQALALKRVVTSCQQLSPIPLLQLPSGF